MELNREQLIKALECCHSSFIADCKQCPYKDKADFEEDFSINCLNVLLKDAISLIKELTEENEQRIEDYQENQRKWEKAYEELEDERDRYKRYYFNHEYDKFEAEVRADTVRKMQERVEALFPSDKNYTTISRFSVKQIAKETLEGENEQRYGNERNS